MSTQLLTGYKADLPPTLAAANGRIYSTNDFDRIQVWNGVWPAAYSSGIAAPLAVIGAPSSAAGNVTLGVHLVRYRYTDSTSPGGAYRSNPSTALAVTVSSTTKKLTFSVGTTGSNIVRSLDPKVDTIELEATTAGGQSYYVVARIANAGITTVDYDVNDTNLLALDLVSIFDDFGHEQPPLGSTMAECRGYMFIGGAHARTVSCGVINGSATVTSSAGFSTQWAGRLIRFGSETTTYTVSAVASASSLTLTAMYAGSTGTVSGLFYARDPNRIYWSKAQFPESWKATERVRSVLSGAGDYLVGLADFLGDLYIFGRRSIQRLVFTDYQSPSAGELNRIAGEFGVWNQRCIYALDGSLFGWGPNGAWILTGGRPRWLSRDIDSTVADLINVAKSQFFHASYDPNARVLRWHFAGNGETSLRYAMAYDLTTGVWMIDTWRQSIDAAATYTTPLGALRLALSDDTNDRIFTHTGVTDGVPVSSTGAYTADNAATTTTTPVTASLPTGAGTDLSKLILYRPLTGEEVVITSNTTGTITHAAFATAMAPGESAFVGAIPVVLETTWSLASGQQDKKRPSALWIKMVPSTAGVARLYLYQDYSATPFQWGKALSEVDRKYITITNGASYAELSLTSTDTNDGFVSVPMPADWARSWKAKLEVISPAGTLRILDIQFAVDRPNAKTVTEE